MSEAALCRSCGGRLAWFPQVGGWRHTWVPAGTQPHPAVVEQHGFVPEVAESDQDTGQRVLAEREEVIARQRAAREALGDFPLVVERPVYRPRAVEPADTGRLVEHPPPVEPARTAFDSELPDAAGKFKALLVEHGWEVEQLYARGYRPDVHQRADRTHLVEQVVIRGRRQQNREGLVACWVDSGYDLGYHLTPGNLQELGVNALKKVVKAPVLTCTVCGQPPHTHPLPADSPACFQEELL